MEVKNKQLIVETCNLCDARCVTCPRELFKEKPCTMSMSLFRKIVDDAAQYGMESIDTCGFGEPLLDKHLFERFEYVRKKMPKAKIFLSTTGFHLTYDKWERIFDLVDIVKFSIYGITKKTYEAFHRGKLDFDVSMLNIHGFLSYISTTSIYTKRKPRTIGLFLETELNSHEEEKWLNHWEPILDEVMIWKPHNWVNGRHYREVDYERQVSCGRPFNAPMYIHADGTVGACCFDPHKGIRLGDMKGQTIEEVYRGDAYRKLRQAHRECDFDSYICKNCDQTNHDPGVLLYANNPDRKVGQLVSNVKDVYEAGVQREVQHREGRDRQEHQGECLVP
jgi:hypothetical protein